jgi:hypothetical protein
LYSIDLRPRMFVRKSRGKLEIFSGADQNIFDS